MWCFCTKSYTELLKYDINRLRRYKNKIQFGLRQPFYPYLFAKLMYRNVSCSMKRIKMRNKNKVRALDKCAKTRKNNPTYSPFLTYETYTNSIILSGLFFKKIKVNSFRKAVKFNFWTEIELLWWQRTCFNNDVCYFQTCTLTLWCNVCLIH